MTQRMMILGWVSAVALLSYSATGLSAVCVRHIYNESGTNWQFTAAPTSGNVYFQGPNCNQVVNGPSIAPTGAVSCIRFTSTHSNASGTLSVAGGDNYVSQLAYGSPAPGSSFCPKYYTQSGFKSPAGYLFVFDSPANGDIIILAAHGSAQNKK